MSSQVETEPTHFKAFNKRIKHYFYSFTLQGFLVQSELKLIKKKKNPVTVRFGWKTSAWGKATERFAWSPPSPSPETLL